MVWWQVALDVKEQIRHDRISIVAAGVAFYALFSMFPAMAALIALYGLVFDPHQMASQIQALQGLLPQQALDVLLDRLQGLLKTDRGALGWGAAAGLFIALWSASRAIKSLMMALNIAYGEREARGFLRRNAVALLLTLGSVLGGILAFGLIVAVPAAARLLGVQSLLGGVLGYSRWAILAAAAIGGMAVLYRYAPSRKHPSWGEVVWGAVAATSLWLAGSAVFSYYVSTFGRFDELYGSVGAIIIMLTWLLLSAYAVLIGAEVNCELERRVRRRRAVSA